jgi:hypothetical protein
VVAGDTNATHHKSSIRKYWETSDAVRFTRVLLSERTGRISSTLLHALN